MNNYSFDFNVQFSMLPVGTNEDFRNRLLGQLLDKCTWITRLSYEELENLRKATETSDKELHS